MPIGACIHVNQSLGNALDHYRRYLQLPYQWQPFKAGEKYSVEGGDFFVLHNSIPEELKTIDVLHHLHSHPCYCAIPIIFVSEDLSPSASTLYDEAEFVWQIKPFDSGEFFQTLHDIQDYIKKNQKLLQYRTKLQVAIHKKEFSLAMKVYQAIQKRYPYPYRSHLLAGEIMYGLKQYDEAIAEVKQAQELIPNSMEADSLLARIYLERGDEAHYQDVMNRMTQKAEIHLKNMIHWGHVYVEKGETLKSLSVYERALEEDPNNVDAQHGYLAANLISGKTEVAKEIIEGSSQALQLARLCNMKGISMANKGQYRSAQKLYRNAMNFLPDKAAEHKLWFNLGLCLKKKGELVDAREMFEKCQATAPKDFKKVHDQIEDIDRKLREQREAEEQEKSKTIADSFTLDYETIIVK
ncbi:tetratricopeptide repeat protein [Pseudobacteriovorax antillogorgiicola]|uniref:Tetratricopeptide repeat-containing protein n=1 Tax=Pseudobacteriovorax antillogorgiicola TaxID=1513793 RepID=A0A1Y6CU41_9BACT|nr:tetratricopeptide repeat protein [Pseudobacteriovorax antillogorgiicola]TCS44598.1 tetratricopeptide repeat protein [Pseudobacteriovorax antillogorgiicola]SMF78147.1 Tetratricopeptide repeat-containing protein [Pseudobacteriovorax antillogorgiicola]